MFEILPESTERCIGFAVSGKVSASYCEQLLPRLDAAIAAHGAINLLVVMTDFDGCAYLDAAKTDFHLGTQEYRHVQRAAFVVDSKWMKRAVKLLDPFTRHTEERIFAPEDVDKAWAWVKEQA